MKEKKYIPISFEKYRRESSEIEKEISLEWEF